jgi:broad specificity phosphatase PhoE
MRLPLTADEKRQIKAAAQRLDIKPSTWARSVLLKACRRAKR